VRLIGNKPKKTGDEEMLKELKKLAKAAKQVNIVFTALKDDRFILGIAPADAGKNKIAPFIAKGEIQEIEERMRFFLDDYITEATSKKAATPADEDCNGNDPDEDEAPKVVEPAKELEPAPEAPAPVAPVVEAKQAEFEF
jgi:hypothetical protein